jgi:ADP-ribose pyrophosphatase
MSNPKSQKFRATLSPKKTGGINDRHLLEHHLSTKRVYSGRAVDFCVDQVRLPNGKKAFREYMDHPGAVGVVPFVDADTIVLVRQYRHPVREVTLEIPAGKMDQGEGRLSCARRELQEETGYCGGVISPLLTYWPTPAFANEVLHLFTARKIKSGHSRLDDDEFLDVVTMSFHGALDLVFNGKIKDSKTIIALLACALQLR